MILLTLLPESFCLPLLRRRLFRFFHPFVVFDLTAYLSHGFYQYNQSLVSIEMHLVAELSEADLYKRKISVRQYKLTITNDTDHISTSFRKHR